MIDYRDEDYLAELRQETAALVEQVVEQEKADEDETGELAATTYLQTLNADTLVNGRAKPGVLFDAVSAALYDYDFTRRAGAKTLVPELLHNLGLRLLDAVSQSKSADPDNLMAFIADGLLAETVVIAQAITSEFDLNGMGAVFSLMIFLSNKVNHENDYGMAKDEIMAMFSDFIEDAELREANG